MDAARSADSGLFGIQPAVCFVTIVCRAGGGTPTASRAGTNTKGMEM